MRGTAPSWVWPAGLGAASVACAVTVTVVGGPVRFAAGVLLALYLPGQTAVLALRPAIGRDAVFGTALAVPLSIATTAAVGLLLAGAGWGFEPRLIGWLLAGFCVPLSVVAALGSRGGRALRWSLRPRTARHWWAALPALALTAFLAVQVVAATRNRAADSYFTEFALSGSGSVLVHSRERGTTRYRYEVRVGGGVRQSAGFTLRPGERREFRLDLSPDERGDVRLYRADDQSPYRRLTP